MMIRFKDITFTAKGEIVSLSSLNLHVEKQGMNSIFTLPTYREVSTVDWQEYDGIDVNFATASLNPTPLDIKIFGTSEDVDALVDRLRVMTTQDDILVGVKIDENNLNNEITFSTKFTKAVKSKLVIENEHQLEYYLLTDEGERHILTESEFEILAGIMEKKWRNIAFATVSFIRYNNVEYFGLLADNTRKCQGIPNLPFTDEEYPSTNMPMSLKRYHVQDRNASLVSVFELYDDLVFCYPLKGVMQGTQGYEEIKSPFVVATENMIGQVMVAKNADKRTHKTISVPVLIRSHSVSAIFRYLGKLKNYIHTTLKSGDMLYLSSEKAGDYAVYPTAFNTTKAYTDMPWVEMTMQFDAYKRGFDFTASTDNIPDDNPDPPLPPTPPQTFDPYAGIDKSKWEACSFEGTEFSMINYLMLANPDYNTTHRLAYPFHTSSGNAGGKARVTNGWSAYAKWISMLPVGTMLFSTKIEREEYGSTLNNYYSLIVTPLTSHKASGEHPRNVGSALMEFRDLALDWNLKSNKLTLVGVVQGCDVRMDSVRNWESQLQDAPRYGGIVGKGTVRVHSELLVNSFLNYIDIAEGLTLTSSSDFDLLIENMREKYKTDASEIFTSQGYEFTLK